MNIEQVIREYLPNVVHMSLATSADNRPWICEVHFVYDGDLNFYFLSKPGRRHSIEIASNPNVAGNIVRQHAADEKPRGVYFEGTAELMENINADSLAYRLYQERFAIREKMLSEVMDDPAGHKFYRITPSNFMLFDTVNFPGNSRQEWRP
jgi:uncharacterized protein YhbP (UPF0306 family)